MCILSKNMALNHFISCLRQILTFCINVATSIYKGQPKVNLVSLLMSVRQGTVCANSTCNSKAKCQEVIILTVFLKSSNACIEILHYIRAVIRSQRSLVALLKTDIFPLVRSADY